MKRIFWLLILVTFDFHLAAQAQGVSPLREVKMRNLGVCFLFAPATPELYFRHPSGEYKKIQIDTSRFSSWNEVPAGSDLTVFKKAPPPATNEGKKESHSPIEEPFVPVQTWNLPPGDSTVRKVFYYRSDGKVADIVLESAPEHCPASRVMVVNLLDQSATIRTGTEGRDSISPRSTKIINPNVVTKQVFTFQFGVRQTDSVVYTSPVKNLRFYSPEERMIILLGYLPNVKYEGGNAQLLGYTPEDIRFYEDASKVPAPPKPFIVPAKPSL